MDKFLSLVLSGGVSGAIFSLLAIGLVVSYSTSRIFNFGHGGVAFATAYLYFQLNTGLGWPIVPALFVTVVLFAPLAGLVWDRLVFRRLRGASEAAKITAGVGVLIVMPALVVFVCDVLKNTFNVGFIDTSQSFKVAGVGPDPVNIWTLRPGVIITSDQLVVLVVGTIAVAALWILLRYTAVGLQMRTAVDSPDLARLRGVNTDRVSSIAWVISFFMAGLAGVLAAPFPGPFGLNADNYTLALFVAATAAVVAGLRSVPIAFAGGLALGALRNLAQGYLTAESAGPVGRWIESVVGLQSSLPYWVLFVTLVLVRQGRGNRSAGTSSSAAPPVDHRVDLSPWRRTLPWLVAGLVLLGYGLFLADSIWRLVILSGLSMGLIFLSFTVVTGLGGMISLAQSAFAGVGALAAGYLLSNGWPFVAAALGGAAVAMALGLVVSLPALRVGGLSLTLATLALALLCNTVLFQIQGFVNGANGWTISRPVLGPLDLSSDRALLVVLFLLVLLVSWLVHNLQHSAAGRAMIAVRTAEPAASSSGVSPVVTKLTVFGISALIAGFGGVMFVTVDGTAKSFTFVPIMGFLWLAIVTVFGVDRPHGAIVAGLVSVVIPRILNEGVHVGSVGWSGTSSQLIPQLLFGLSAIALAQRPDGVLSQVAEGRAKRRARHAADTGVAEGAVAHGLAPDVGTRTAPIIAPLPEGTEALLVLEGVHAGYGEVEVLHGVDLTIGAGQALALLGANGAGKSTLAAVVAGLVPVTAGRILFRGTDITALSSNERAKLGLVLVPESRGIFPSVTVEDNLRLWLRSSAELDLVFERFPILASRRKQPAGNLSGGEQQMLSVAPLLARRPVLLISDEPTLGLSPMVSAELMKTFGAIQEEGTTLLLIEEKARDVLGVVDRVGALARGSLQWVQAKADVDGDQLAAAYLGMAGAPPPESVTLDGQIDLLDVADPVAQT